MATTSPRADTGATRAPVVRWAGIITAVVLAFGLSACGEYSPVERDSVDASTDAPRDGEVNEQDSEASPTDEGTTDAENQGEEEETGAIPETYTWALPPTDTSPQLNDGPAYALLQLPDGCAAARQYMAENLSGGAASLYGTPYGFSNPRYAVFYAAGVALCQGDPTTARALYDHAVATFTLVGIDRSSHPADETGVQLPPPRRRGYGEPECDLYRTLTSMLTHVSADSVACRGGVAPAFTFVIYTTDDGEPITVFDDPVTVGRDESLEPPAGWNHEPGVPGTAGGSGAEEYGDPDDEFGYENSEGGL